jgi:peptidoglycan-associated lipoprotein
MVFLEILFMNRLKHVSVVSRCAVLAGVLLLTACGSTVKLDEAPVQDRTAVPVGRDAAGQGAGAGSADSRSVSAVDLEQKKPTALPTELQRVVYFDYDSFEVKAEYAGLLEAQARFLAANQGLRLGLEGHTDERGGREYNLALGQKRAEAVRRSLSLLGVKDAQMEAVSFGEEKPAAQCGSEQSHGRNRRVEFSLR